MWILGSLLLIDVLAIVYLGVKGTLHLQDYDDIGGPGGDR
jgi:hypothetical protein